MCDLSVPRPGCVRSDFVSDEYHSAALENARFWIRRLHILRVAPLSTARDGKPGIVLCPCGFDPFVTGVSSEVALDDLGADDEHRWNMAQNSKKWNMQPPLTAAS